MNKLLHSGNSPSESFLSRSISRIRYLGIRAIPRLVFYGLLPASVYYRSTRCVWMDLDDWREQGSVNTVPFEIRPLDAEDLKSQQKLIDLDLNSRDADVAI